MSDEKNVTRLELLKMAVQLVTNEYIDTRAQDHNAWLAKSEALWKARREKLPYPAFPPYPNESMIVARANILSEFLNPTPPAPAAPVAEFIEDTVEIVAISTPEPMSVYTQAPTEAPAPESTTAPTEVPTEAPAPEPTEPEPTAAPVTAPEPTAAPEPIVALKSMLVYAPDVDNSHEKYSKEITAIFQNPAAIEAPANFHKTVQDSIVDNKESPAEIEKKSMIEQLSNYGKSSDTVMPAFANWRAAWRRADSQ